MFDNFESDISSIESFVKQQQQSLKSQLDDANVVFETVSVLRRAQSMIFGVPFNKRNYSHEGSPSLSNRLASTESDHSSEGRLIESQQRVGIPHMPGSQIAYTAGTICESE